MAGGGFCKLPNGTVVVALTLTRPADGSGPYGGTGTAPGAPVRVLVHAANRARALTRLRNLGLRAVYLRGNDRPPTPDEVTAVLHHPDGLLWRGAPQEGPAPVPPGGPGPQGGQAAPQALPSCQELWRPIRALLGPTGYAGPARPAA
ncbi:MULTISPECIES: hypothetical protein [Streptomyces]|uniref:hypothetical protein n=1 Tax=Streptomyces TaxID=1883 RepID=UPI0006AD8F55|nr:MULTISPECIES: hypothetical protein [Streptomyces]KOU46186.1 hypothetical protein ADK56_30825 [Streptomyces sp. MMG1522]MDW4912359.1 hypothetical protein [Streptomyces californicus]